MVKLSILLFGLAACSTTPDTHWRCEHIASSSRLIYDNPNSHLKLEFLKLQDGITAFAYTDLNSFSPSKEDPQATELTVKLGDLVVKELVSLRKGNMRMKLGTKLTEQLIYALKDQKEIAILTSRVEHNSFEKAFSQFSNGTPWLINSIKGPLE